LVVRPGEPKSKKYVGFSKLVSAFLRLAFLVATQLPSPTWLPSVYYGAALNRLRHKLLALG